MKNELRMDEIVIWVSVEFSCHYKVVIHEGSAEESIRERLW